MLAMRMIESNKDETQVDVLRGRVDMDRQPGQAKLASSHLFVVRIWCEWVGENNKEWRGQVEQVLNGKVGYFRNWSMLVSFLKEALAALDPEGGPAQSETTSGLDTDGDGLI